MGKPGKTCPAVRPKKVTMVTQVMWLGGSSQCLMTLVSKSPGVILQVMCLVQPTLRNFVIFNLQPQQPLADAWPDAADVHGVRRLVRAFWVPGC